jgi:transcriptional regulator with XRE-family HTH domain
MRYKNVLMGYKSKFAEFKNSFYIIVMDIDAFWKRVKEFIKKKGMTQNTMAIACGIPPATFRGWTSKRVVPTVDCAFAIAQYLGVSVEYLVKGRGLDKVSRTAEEVIGLLNRAESKIKEIRRSVP